MSFALSALLPAETLRVASYNVRYPASGDGANLWELRRELFVSSVRALDPDLMGTQELFALQAKYLVEKAPEYSWFGLSRQGNSEDEHMGVFYKPSKLTLLDSGHFWLSETPSVPASMSWDVTLPRMVTWGLFESKATRRRFYFANTHFPHRGQDAAARLNCAKIIAERLTHVPNSTPIILTGDFNAPAGGDVHQLLAASLTDSWTAAPQRFGPTGTFHGFSGKPGADRIDWILTRGFTPLLAQTATLESAGKYPSDHFPVLAVFDWQ